MFGRHGTFALVTQKSEVSTVHSSAANAAPGRLEGESTFSCAELDIYGVSYFCRTCAQP